jgi:hypothetical protein
MIYRRSRTHPIVSINVLTYNQVRAIQQPLGLVSGTGKPGDRVLLCAVERWCDRVTSIWDNRWIVPRGRGAVGRGQRFVCPAGGDGRRSYHEDPEGRPLLGYTAVTIALRHAAGGRSGPTVPSFVLKSRCP